MRNQEFAYWLQGYFELTNHLGCPTLAEKQAEIIANHIKLVKEVEYNLDEFISWLSGYLEAKKNVLDVHDTTLIKVRLDDRFKHVIDDSYGLDNKKLQIIHDGKKPPPSPPPPPPFGGTLYRC